MDLRFTPRRVKELEDKAHKPITQMVSDSSVTSMVVFVRSGLGLDNDEQALGAIETYLNEGGDMFDLLFLIIEKLQVGGFLPRAFPLAELREKVKDPNFIKKLLAEAMGSAMGLELSGQEESPQP